MTNKEAAVKIVKRLRDEGFEALLAGGCVRDMLLGREAKDYDVATNARPEQVSKIFRRTLTVGAQFGVVIVLVNSGQVEVATFRTESGYADGRHPENVSFSNAHEDAARRDFTINGMFYDPTAEEVLDYVGGRKDLEKQILKTIGDPYERFDEDYLRLMRAVRFSAQLGFEIEDSTWQAVCEKSKYITMISGERISMELEKILVCQNRAEGLKELLESGLAGFIFKDFKDQKASYGIEVLSRLTGDADYMLGLASVFSGFDTKKALSMADILMLSNIQRKKLESLLENRGTLMGEVTLADMKNLLYSGYFQDLIELETSIQKVNGGDLDKLYEIRKEANKLEGTEVHPQPFLNGNELMELGVQPGPKLGQILKEMYYRQLNEQIQDKTSALEWIKKEFPADFASTNG